VAQRRSGRPGCPGILHAHGNAEFAIALGERRGQGLGSEATRLVLDSAFHVLHLRNVLLETLEWNHAGLTAYERAGFRRIGVRRAEQASGHCSSTPLPWRVATRKDLTAAW
jgi:RimJ/RimL family protein N-acetyltransferase